MRLIALQSLWFLLAAGACVAQSTPTLLPGAAEVDSTRLIRHVAVLAADSMQGRRPGTPGADRARRYIVEQMRQAGLESVGASFEHPFDPGNRGRAVNLIGRIAGSTHPERVVLITAHYDHVGIGRPVAGDSIYNGADDNASGTAALLEMARYFSRNRPQATLVFAALDAEEMGLLGAEELVRNPLFPLRSIAVNVNMDMVSHSERGELYAAGTRRYPFLRKYVEAVASRSRIALRMGHDTPSPSPSDDWTEQSDHFVFHRAGIPFLYFGVEDHDDYHRPSDELETITQRFFVGAVSAMIDAVRTLDASIPEVAARR